MIIIWAELFHFSIAKSTFPWKLPNYFRSAPAIISINITTTYHTGTSLNLLEKTPRLTHTITKAKPSITDFGVTYIIRS
jgi:hypothetical protein